MPITNVPTSLATTSKPGQMGATDKAKLDGLSPAGWLDTVARQMAVAAPGVTMTIPLDFRSLRGTNLVTPTTYGAMPSGGGVNPAGSTFTAITDVIVITPETQPWAFAFRANIPVPVAGQYFNLGIGNAATNAYYICEQYNAGARATQLSILQWRAASPTYQQGSGYVIDAAFHTFMLAYDLVNVKLYVDNVLWISTPPLGPTGGCYVCANSSNHYVPVTDFAYAV